MRGQQTLSVMNVTSDVAIGSWGDVLFCEWIADTGVEATKVFVSALQNFSANKPGGIGLITVIRRGSSIPRTQARDMMAKALKETNIVVSAAIMEGAGFRASAVRGFVQGLSMLARNQYPHRVFGTIDECADWFATAAEDKTTDWTFAPKVLSSAISGFQKESQKRSP